MRNFEQSLKILQISLQSLQLFSKSLGFFATLSKAQSDGPSFRREGGNHSDYNDRYFGRSLLSLLSNPEGLSDEEKSYIEEFLGEDKMDKIKNSDDPAQRAAYQALMDHLKTPPAPARAAPRRPVPFILPRRWHSGPDEPRAGERRRIPSGTASPWPTTPDAKKRIALLRRIADEYVDSIGLPRVDHDHRPITHVDEDFHTEMARVYHDMEHNPNDPKVRASYEALIKETIDQYNALRRAGLTFKPITGEVVDRILSETKGKQADPYHTLAANMLHDLHHHGELWYFPTLYGFGSDSPPSIQRKEGESDEDFADRYSREGEKVAMYGDGLPPGQSKDSGNLLLKRADTLVEGGKPKGHPGLFVANDVFRIVHDIMGHGLVGGKPSSGRDGLEHGWRGYTFGPHGEESAWRHHWKMYTPAARSAMTQELRGQNSVVNYGLLGRPNRFYKPTTVYAKQKNGVWPDKYMRMYGEKYGGDQEPDRGPEEKSE